MTEYIISDELLSSICQVCYRAGKAGKEAFSVRTPSVEIVRCGECKHYDEDAGFCTRFREVVEEHLDLDWPYQIPEWGYLESTPDDYCSWGKRREDA